MQKAIEFTPVELSGEELISELVVLLQSLASSRSGTTTPVDVLDGEIWTKTTPTGERFAMLHYDGIDTAIAKINAQGQLLLDAGELSGTIPAARLSGTYPIDVSGNSATTTKLAAARTIALSGAATGTATNFDGTANITIAVTALNAGNLTAGIVPAARLPLASTSSNGAMSAADKTKLDGATDAGNLTSGTVPSARLTGTYPISISGNAATATTATSATSATTAAQLATARTIALSGAATGTATSFNASANITIPVTALNAANLTAGTVPPARLSGTYPIDVSGNAATTTKLLTARTFAIGTGATGTATSFDGSGNVIIPITGINADYLSSGMVPTARLPVATISAVGAMSAADKMKLDSMKSQWIGAESTLPSTRDANTIYFVY